MDVGVRSFKSIITITITTIDLVCRLQIERRRIKMSGTLKDNETGIVWELKRYVKAEKSLYAVWNKKVFEEHLNAGVKRKKKYITNVHMQ